MAVDHRSPGDGSDDGTDLCPLDEAGRVLRFDLRRCEITEKLKSLLVSKAEELGWKVNIDENCWEFQKYSPAGEDFWLSISGEDVVDELLEYYEEFDTEDHVMGLMEAKKNGFRGVPSLKELVEDADAIEKMIEELYDALHDVESEYYEEQEEYLS